VSGTNPFARLIAPQTAPEATAPASNPFAGIVGAASSDGSATPKSGETTYDLSEVPAGMARNFGSNLKSKLSGLYEAIFDHPLQTYQDLNRMAEAVFNPVGDLIKGPEGKSVIADTAKQLEERYGSFDAAKRTAVEDPIGFWMDLASVLPSSRVVTGTGMAAKTARGALKAVEATDPANIAGGVANVASKGADKVASLAQLLSQSEHGIAAGSLKELFQSGEKVTPGVWKTLAKGLDPTEARAKLGNVLHELFDERGDSYLTDMAKIEGNATPVDFKMIDAAVNKAGGIGHYKASTDKSAGPGYNFEKNQSIKDARGEILAEIERFRQMGPEYHTAYGFDKLKQAVQQIGENMKEANGMPSRGSAFANTIADSIVKTVEKQAPEYGAVMRKYHDDSNTIRNLMREFSFGKPNSNPLTTLKKLQSVWRDHANLGYGAKADFLKDVAKRTGNEDLPALLAANEYHPWTPRGLRGVGLGLEIPMAAAHAALSPATGLPHLGTALGGAAMMSPRLMGTAAYGAGRVAPYARPLGKAYRGAANYTPWLMRADRWSGEEPQEKRGGFFSGR
jgi:hypothetical protein